MKKNTLYKISDLLWAFFLPAVIFSLILLRHRILPFGNTTLLFSDLDTQYIEFMAEYRRILLGEGDIFWSWHAGIGLNFIGLLAYYLASPFNFLLVCFPEDQLPLAVSVLTLLKLSFAGLAFGYYLRNHYKTRSFLAPLFASCYALSAFALGYAFNIIWLDALIWLPLLCSGIDRILGTDGRSMPRLTLFFALSFLSQFYMAWMTGAFCVIYLFAQILQRKCTAREFFRVVIRFGICVGLAAGLSAFLLLPTFFVLKNNMGLLGQSFPAMSGKFFFPEILQKLFIGSFDGIKDCLPHIYCGIPALIGLAAFFLGRESAKREKIISAVVTVLLLISFWFAPLDFLWHAMDHPSWFPYRYAFVFCFWVLSLAFKGFTTCSFRDIWIAIALTTGVLLVACIFITENKVRFLLINGLFLAAYSFLFYLLRKRPLVGDRRGELGFSLLIMAELLLNGIMIISRFTGGYTRLEDYQKFRSTWQPLMKAVESDSDFYRMEKTGFRNYNDPLGIGYAGVSHFSSTASSRQAEYLKRLGFNCYATWCTYEGTTAVSDAMLGIRYEFGPSGKQDSIQAGDNTWEHPAQFPLFYFADESFARYDFSADVGTIVRQNDLLRLLAGEGAEDYFTAVPMKVTDVINLEQDVEGDFFRVDSAQNAAINVEIDPIPGKSLYLFLPGASLSHTVTVNGTDELMNGNRDYAPFPICLDAYTDEGPVHIRIEPTKGRLAGIIEAYALDTDRLAELSEAVTQNAPRIERLGNTDFRLTAASSDQDRLVVSSVPFDAGWQVSTKSGKLPLKMIHDSMVGFILPAGVEEVHITYRPYGWKEGCILSVAALVIWAGLLLEERRFTRVRLGMSR